MRCLDFAGMCAVTIPLVSIGGQAEGQACADLGRRTPIGGSRILLYPPESLGFKPQKGDPSTWLHGAILLFIF